LGKAKRMKRQDINYGKPKDSWLENAVFRISSLIELADACGGLERRMTLMLTNSLDKNGTHLRGYSQDQIQIIRDFVENIELSQKYPNILVYVLPEKDSFPLEFALEYPKLWTERMVSLLTGENFKAHEKV
jgi:hypothetical protein